MMNKLDGWEAVWEQAQESPFITPRVKNNACNEIGHPSTHRRNIMTENTSQTTTIEMPTEPTLEEPTRLQKFVIQHPRAAKIVAITGAVTAVTGIVLVANTMRKNSDHLSNAGELSLEALQEMSESVSPTPDTDN